MSWNAITGLQDGVFDSLRSLETLDLSHNQINFIELRVFSSDSDLGSLRRLNIDNNKLTSLEPWWYYRCIHDSSKSPVIINLSHNLITNFTNKLQFHFRCNMKKVHGSVNIGGNPVSHLMDMFNGWNITGPEVYRCLNYIQKQYRYLRFYLLGLNLSCDCVDYEILKHTWNTPVFGALQGVHCIDHNTGLTKPINTINMIDVVCELPDRCPSSCQCVYRPDNTTLHIYCSTANLSSLPLDLPPLPKSDVRYKLDFSNNKRLQHVGHRPYFLNTSILDISNCSISEVTMDVLEDLSHINVADFRGNLLQSFSRKADTLNISAKLLLGLNPWRCPCDNSWMI